MAIFAGNDHTYYNYLNLTKEVDISTSNGLTEGKYVQTEEWKDSSEEFSDEDIKHNIVNVHDNPQRQHVDDLDILDTDGDGIINIGGNHYKIKILRKKLKKCGMIDINGKFGSTSYESTRSKYESVRNTYINNERTSNSQTKRARASALGLFRETKRMAERKKHRQYTSMNRQLLPDHLIKLYHWFPFL